MAKVTIKFQETTREQRRKMLREACESIDVNQTLASLVEKMRLLEEQYGISTIEFYTQFIAGKMGDCRDFIRWAAAFQSYQDLLREYFGSEVKAKAA